MHSPDLCNKIVKVTADDREIEVVEKGTCAFVFALPLFSLISQMFIFPKYR